MQTDTHQWLAEGEQSKITPRIKEIAVSQKGKHEFEYMLNLLDWIRKNLTHDTEHWKEFIRRRTADDVVASGFSTGCGDDALVFCTLARAGGIPTVFIEAPYKDWLVRELDGRFDNHCFAHVYVGDKEYLIDPTRGNIGIGSLKAVGGGIEYVVMNEGLDMWEFGIKNWDEYKEKYLAFREHWRAENV